MGRYHFQQLCCAHSKTVGEYRDQTVLDMIAVIICLNGPWYSHKGMKMCPCLLGKLEG